MSIYIMSNRRETSIAHPSDIEGMEKHQDERFQAPADISPTEQFKRVVIADAKQNQRLTNKLNGSNSDKAIPYSKGSTKMRFVVCTLGLISLAMSQMSRMVINQSIPQMIDPMQISHVDDHSISTDGSCPRPQDDQTASTTSAPMTSTTPVPEPTSTAITSTSSTISPIPTSTSTTTTAITMTQTTTTTWTTMATTTTTAAKESTSSGPPTSKPSTSHPFDIYPISVPTEPNVLAADQNMDELPDMEIIMDPEDNPSEVSATHSNPHNATQQVDGSSKEEVYSYERFNWTMQQQNVLLGGFYYSYFVFMILGGRLSEIYGAKYVILLAVAGSALINLATPWMAHTSFTLLVMSRVVMGAIQSGVFPAMYALISKWLTMSEASIFAPMIKMNLRLGMVFGSLIPGLISGWPNVFYFTGFVCAIWCVAWMVIATSDPADNKWVSPGELAHIIRKKRKPKQPEMIEMSDKNGAPAKVSQKRSLKTPWLKIWTAPPVIGLIIVKLTFNYALDFLAIELPSYLKYVHHASRQKISAITTPMFGIQVCLIVFVGWLAKICVQRRPLGLTKTGCRKLFQGITSFGTALCFFLLTFNDCNLIYVAILLQIVSFLSMFTAGGETMLPYDLSEEYPATIMSIANSVANISGITTTTLAAIVLGDQGGSYHRWNILIYLIAGANLIGGLAFTLLVKAEQIDFDADTKTCKTNEQDLEATAAAAAKKSSDKPETGSVEIKLNSS